MKRRALPVWCEISCASCGSFVGGTYCSPKSIAKYRREAKEDGFIWDKEARKVLCPKCAKKQKEESEKNKNLPRKCGDCKYACFLDVLRCEVLGRVQGDWHIVSEDTLYEDCPLKDARGAGFPDRPPYGG